MQPSRGQDQESFLESDAFKMYCFKVLPCDKRFVHDWSGCPFAHHTEKARRRCPRTFEYAAIACPDLKQGCCPRGERCSFAHTIFELWLHPDRYRTQMCNSGTLCNRKSCFFAHTPEQLRFPAIPTIVVNPTDPAPASWQLSAPTAATCSMPIPLSHESGMSVLSDDCLTTSQSSNSPVASLESPQDSWVTDDKVGMGSLLLSRGRSVAASGPVITLAQLQQDAAGHDATGGALELHRQLLLQQRQQEQAQQQQQQQLLAMQQHRHLAPAGLGAGAGSLLPQAPPVQGQGQRLHDVNGVLHGAGMVQPLGRQPGLSLPAHLATGTASVGALPSPPQGDVGGGAMVQQHIDRLSHSLLVQLAQLRLMNDQTEQLQAANVRQGAAQQPAGQVPQQFLPMPSAFTGIGQLPPLSQQQELAQARRTGVAATAAGSKHQAAMLYGQAPPVTFPAPNLAQLQGLVGATSGGVGVGVTSFDQPLLERWF